MKITKNQLRRIIKEELDVIVSEARSPRSAKAFAQQVLDTLNSREKLSLLPEPVQTGNYGAPHGMSGGYLNKRTWDEGDEEIGLPIYDLKVFVRRVDRAREILQDAYGPIRKMRMGRAMVDAIPVGNYAIVFGVVFPDIHVGISKVVK